ncbi:hypothetical protein JCM10207_003105 [Rhodosporidiobolus poonsookiae]
MVLGGLISRATANFKNTSTPTTWSPADPLPTGFSSRVQPFQLPLSSLGSFQLRTIGHYSTGTVVFQRATAGAAELDEGYDDQVGGKSRQAGIVEIGVEARYNSEGLYSEARVDPMEAHERCGLTVTTPASTSVSRIGAVLSFHITVTFPASFTALDSLVVEATAFRVILDPSLAPVTISNLQLTTTDAPISLSDISAQHVTIKNRNVLDPNKTALKNFEDLVSGNIVRAERVEVRCEDGPVSLNAACSGALILATTNGNIASELSGSSLRVTTVNGEVVGKFVAKRDVQITNTYGKIEVEVEAPFGCLIGGSNSSIDGKFLVGKELKLITTHFRIDATVRILAPSSSLSAQPARPPSPAPSSATDLPPTFEEAVGSSAVAPSTFDARVETTGAAIQLDYVEQPEGVVVSSFAKSSGGGRIEVVHPGTFEGSFSANTSLTHTATLAVPETFSTATRKRAVHYDTNKRSEVAGSVRFEGGGADQVGGGRGRTVVEAHGPIEIKLL